MSKPRHLGTALANLISIKQISQSELSVQTKVSQPAINRLILGTRPEPGTLSAICQYWEIKSDGLSLLIEHLRDEIERANYKTESIHIEPRYDADNLTTLTETLISAARIDKDIRALLYDLGALITRSKLDL